MYRKRLFPFAANFARLLLFCLVLILPFISNALDVVLPSHFYSRIVALDSAGDEISNFSNEIHIYIDSANKIEEQSLSPNDFVLYPNYSNSFNSTTKIKVFLPQTSKIRIEAFNALGKKITTLYNIQLDNDIRETFSAI